MTNNSAKWLKKVKEARENLNHVEGDSAKTENDIKQARSQLKQALEKYKHRDIKDALIAMFSGKCAYCESKINHITYGAIEHFRPKGEPTFEHLVFEWTNLLLSCDICNDAGHKGTRFPVDANNHPLLIDPTDGVTHPNTHLDFSWDPVAGLASVYGRDARGEAVEQIFELNRKELLKVRSLRVKTIMTLLEFAKAGNAKAIALLQESCESNAEYSAFARVYIQPHFP